MKRMIFIYILLLSPYLCSAESEYLLENLTNNASEYTGDYLLQNFMKSETDENYKDCENQLKANNVTSANYFSSLAIKVSSSINNTYLVFPSKSCFAFFGAHSVQFWIVEKTKTESYKVLLTDRQDGLKILNSYTNGYADIEVFYNDEKQIYSYNGNSYLAKNQ